MSALSPPGIERFCAALEDACGLAYTPEKAYLFETRLGPFLAARGLTTYDELARLLREDMGARQAITEALVTSETYFFRDPATFEALPALLAARGASAGRPAVVWSLGCATGQEVWSILFTLAATGAMPAEAVRAYGVDISRAALDRAREASYTTFELRRGLEPWQVTRFFEPAPDGGRVARPWRDQPTWVQGNLLDGPDALPRPDVVFCRNVLIYFRDDVKRRIVAAIARRLAPGGVLLLGNAENRLLFADLLAPSAVGPTALASP